MKSHRLTIQRGLLTLRIISEYAIYPMAILVQSAISK